MENRITFLTPPPVNSQLPIERVFGCNYGLYPIPNIFFLSCAAVLKRSGYDTVYIDGSAGNISKNGFFKRLEEDRSCLYLFYAVNLSIQDDLTVLQYIRKVRGDVSVIFMGPAPTYFPEIFLVDPNVFIIRGEPEMSIAELTHFIVKGQGSPGRIKGISYRVDSLNIVHNPLPDIVEDLDSLPMPSRCLLDTGKYYNPKLLSQPTTAMLTSRGCSHRCIYCVPNSLSFARELEYKKEHGRKPPVRLHSEKRVIDEFQTLKKEGYRSVSILDDQFIWGENRTLDICKGVKDLNIKWGCLARADYLNERMIKAMAEANCSFIDIGVESFVPDILEYVKKDLDIDKTKDAIRLLKKYKIWVKINILFGCSPMENEETMRYTFKTIQQLQPDGVMFGVCNPFPGTEFYDLAVREGWIPQREYSPSDPQSQAIINYPNVKKEVFERFTRKANMKFYLHPRFLRKNIVRLGSSRQFYSTMGSFIKRFLISDKFNVVVQPQAPMQMKTNEPCYSVHKTKPDITQ